MGTIRVLARNYKCFGDEPQGLTSVSPVNVIVGRNNAGKSALLDLVEYSCVPRDFDGLGHMGKVPEVLLTKDIDSDVVAKVFSGSASGGGIPGPTHRHFGDALIGRPLTIGLNKDGKALFKTIEPEMEIDNEAVAKKLQVELVKAMQFPMRGLSFRRVLAERDVKREGGDGAAVSPDGSGVTSIYRHFALDSSTARLPHLALLTRDLNEMVAPELRFSQISVRLASQTAEVYLTEEGKGPVPLSSSGSGIKTLLHILALIHLVPTVEGKSLDKYVFGIEEPESHLHPAVQRRLMAFLLKTAKNTNSRMFITTHSSAIIDFFAGASDSQILHVSHSGVSATVAPVASYLEKVGILDDIGVRASDLLQSNGVIWVEGPTDRMYVNRWIELWTDGELREGAHYQCVMYGGRLIAHLDGRDPDEGTGELISLLRVNRNAAVLVDSDSSSEGATGGSRPEERSRTTFRALCCGPCAPRQWSETCPRTRKSRGL
ncbi:MAG: AAA family ATPase [Planctomycetes bacterium]|nr:AAA family ATPase [Planctomycetota bacterium]